MQVKQHLLLQFVLAIVDRDGVIVPIQSMDQGLDTWFVQISDIRGRLSRLMTDCCSLRIDQSKCVDHNFSFDRLDRVDDNSYCSIVQLLEALPTCHQVPSRKES